MSAWGSFATPLITLIRSKTTRRSAPIIRSRLRSPISKSTTATFTPVRARAAPSAAVDVVLPTPPLPDVTTITLPMWSPPNPNSFHRCNHQCLAREPRLDRPVAQLGVEILRRAVIAVDRQKFRLEAGAEDARLPVAGRPRHGAAPQRAVDVDGTAGDHLGARSDRPQHGDVAAGKEDRLAGAHRDIDQERRLGGLRRGLRLRP